MYENEVAAIQEYLKYFPNDNVIQNKFFLYQCCQKLDVRIGKNYYPRISGEMIAELADGVYAQHYYYLRNSATGYQQNGEDMLVVCRYPEGRYTFRVDDDEYFLIEDEWNEFISTLKSYHPIDYDGINNTYIYDVEHGKQLLKDYKEICSTIAAKIRKKRDLKIIEKKKEQLESLKRELEHLEGAESNGNK